MDQTTGKVTAKAWWRTGETREYGDGMTRDELLRLLGEPEVTDVEILTPSGDRLRPIEDGAHRLDHIKRATNVWLKAEMLVKLPRADQFTINEATGYWGLHDPETEWNGWAVPYFPLVVAKRILKDMTDSGAIQSAYYDKAQDALMVLDNDCDEYVQYRGVACLSFDHSVMWVYPLGGFDWCWSIA